MRAKFLLFSITALSFGSLWGQWFNPGGYNYTNTNAGIGPAFSGSGAPTQTLDVDGNIRIRGLSLLTRQDNTLGRVLVSDANGNLYWRDIASVSGGFSGSFTDLTNIPVNLDLDATDDFDGNFSSLTNIPADLSDGDDVDDADADATNELQTLSLTGSTLSISNGNNVELSSLTGANFPSFPESAGDGGGPTNSFFGHQSGLNNMGLNNTFIGWQSGLGNTTGTNNTFVGRRSGFGNETGSGNVFIGYNAGASAGFTTSNQLYIANSDTNTPLIRGDFQNNILSFNGDVGIGTPAPQASLHVAGNVQIDGDLGVNTITANQIEGIASAALVPEGVILMWSGSLNDVPSGWAVCDGTNGTPDLRGRFIVGYDPGDIDYDNVGNTGGEKEHTLTVNEMPSHNHPATGNTSSDGQHTHDYGDLIPEIPWDGDYCVGSNCGSLHRQNNMRVTEPAGNHSHSLNINVGNTGNGQAHENRPPYYALVYIMKLTIQQKPAGPQTQQETVPQQEAQTDENTVDASNANTQLPESQGPIAVNEPLQKLPEEEFALYQNVPNPFDTTTLIEAVVPESVQQAKIIVYNLQGLELESYAINNRGKVSVKISAGHFPSGMYLYALLADNRLIDTKKMILTR